MSGGQTMPAPELQQVFTHAQKEADRLKDEYISTEHLLLALAEVRVARPRRCSRWPGRSRDAILAALKDVRGSQRVTDQNPEDKYQALERYGRDLVRAGPPGQARPGDRPRRGNPPRACRCSPAGRRTTPC